MTMKEARAIAGEWYAGKSSGLYKIVCNETYEKLTLEDWANALYEAQKEASDCRIVGLRKDGQVLSGLAAWIQATATAYGKSVTGL